MRAFRFAVAASFLVPLLVTGTGTSAPEDAPRVVAGFRDGPVSFSGNDVELARLLLPAGRWDADVKLVLSNNAVDLRRVSCRTDFGSATIDRGATRLSAAGDYDAVIPLAFTAPVVSERSRALKLICSTPAALGEVNASWIKMDAVEIGRLTVVRPRGGAETGGSGKPRVISSYRKELLLTHGELVTVARLELPRGRWLVSAKTLISDTSETLAGNIFCHIVRGESEVEIDSAVLTSMLPRGGKVVYLHGSTKVPEGGQAAKLRCQSNTSSDYLVARSTRVTAMKIGRLTKIDELGTTTTQGSGAPRVFDVSLGETNLPADSSVVSLGDFDLPPGDWKLTGRVGVYISVGSGAGIETTCTLDAAGDFDRTTLNDGFGVVQVAHTVPGPTSQTVEASCSHTGTSSNVHAIMRITAVKASDLTNTPL